MRTIIQKVLFLLAVTTLLFCKAAAEDTKPISSVASKSSGKFEIIQVINHLIDHKLQVLLNENPEKTRSEIKIDADEEKESIRHSIVAGGDSIHSIHLTVTGSKNDQKKPIDSGNIAFDWISSGGEQASLDRVMNALNPLKDKGIVVTLKESTDGKTLIITVEKAL